MEKYCSYCQTVKDFDDFPRNSKNPDGKSYYCFPCTKEYIVNGNQREKKICQWCHREFLGAPIKKFCSGKCAREHIARNGIVPMLKKRTPSHDLRQQREERRFDLNYFDNVCRGVDEKLFNCFLKAKMEFEKLHPTLMVEIVEGHIPQNEFLARDFSERVDWNSPHSVVPSKAINIKISEDSYHIEFAKLMTKDQDISWGELREPCHFQLRNWKKTPTVETTGDSYEKRTDPLVIQR